MSKDVHYFISHAPTNWRQGRRSCQCLKRWVFDFVFDQLESMAQKAHDGATSHINHPCVHWGTCVVCVYLTNCIFFSINSNPAKTSQCLQNLMQAICWRGFSVFRLIKCKTVGEDLTKSTDADLESMSVIFFLGYRTTILVEDCGAWQTLLDRQLSLSVRFSCLPVHTTLPTTCVTSDLWPTQGQIPLS